MSYLGNHRIFHALLVRGEKTTPSEWQADTVYYVGEVVIYNGVYYVCIKVTQGYLDTPDMFPDEWERLSGGSFKGEYSPTESYSQFDLVMCEGNLYEAQVDSPVSPPYQDMASHWEQLTFYTSGESTIPEGYIKPVGELTITENGTHDVTNYASVAVSVPSATEIPDGYIKPSGTLNITSNGTYDVAEYASAEVNVEGENSYRGEYSYNATYKSGDIVVYQGNVYRCLNENRDFVPPNYLGMYWEQLNATQTFTLSVGRMPTEVTVNYCNGAAIQCATLQEDCTYTLPCNSIILFDSESEITATLNIRDATEGDSIYLNCCDMQDYTAFIVVSDDCAGHTITINWGE